jgi:hypothetical protein
VDDDGNKISLECLLKTLEETQQTIRAYDVKSEVLTIILTLIVSIVNFNMVSEFKSCYSIRFLSLVSLVLTIFSLLAAGLVLFPRKNLFKQIILGTYKPKFTYFVDLDIVPSFRNLDEYLNQVDSTDWKKEVAYEVLKTSCIRDHKHRWFKWASMLSGITLTVIIGILILAAGASYG